MPSNLTSYLHKADFLKYLSFADIIDYYKRDATMEGVYQSVRTVQDIVSAVLGNKSCMVIPILCIISVLPSWPPKHSSEMQVKQRFFCNEWQFHLHEFAEVLCLVCYWIGLWRFFLIFGHSKRLHMWTVFSRFFFTNPIWFMPV